MITMFTGVPGAGKTAALVDLLRTLGKDRAIYSRGLEGLTLPHFDVDPLEWHKTVPDGSIIVVDEVQEFWRPRSSGAKVPDCIAELETHRHKGIDFFVTTQHPGLIDANVRSLVGRHVHIRDVGLLGRWWYEWPEAANVQQYKNAPTQRRYKLPKDVFSLYKSASIHTTPVRSFPRAVMWLGLLIVLFLAGLAYAYHSIGNKLAPPGPSSTASQAARVYSAGNGMAGLPITAASIVDSFKPRIPSRADTAPAYDALRVVVNMPRVTGGYCVGSRCKCINQQNLDAGLTADECRSWLKAPPFDPYYAPATVAGDKPPARAQQPAQPSTSLPPELLAGR